MLPRPYRFIPPLGPPRKSPRERALATLRGIDLAPLEKIRERPATRVASVLPALMKKLRMEKRQGEAEIVRVWNHILDPVITAHAQPVNLAQGTLFVNVDSPVWKDEIVRNRRKEILTRMQHSFGEAVIQKISFRIG